MLRIPCRAWPTGWLLTLLLASAILPNSARAQAPVYLTQWGTAGSGSGQFHDPMHVAADHEGNVYVQDYDARIQKFSSEGAFLTLWGGAHSCQSGQFGPFAALATDAAGILVVGDASCARIQKFTATGTLLAEWAVPSPGGVFFPNSPRAVAVDQEGTVYVGYFNFDLHLAGTMKFNGTGVLLTNWPMSDVPGGLATDAAGNVYATLGEHVLKFTSDGAFLTQWSGGSQHLHGIAIDAADHVYVSDVSNDRILKYTTDGTLLAQWGSLGSGDGQFNDPRGVAVDGDGNVYVVDSVNQRVQKFGYAPTAAKPTSWGRLKRLYR